MSLSASAVVFADAAYTGAVLNRLPLPRFEPPPPLPPLVLEVPPLPKPPEDGPPMGVKLALLDAILQTHTVPNAHVHFTFTWVVLKYLLYLILK